MSVLEEVTPSGSVGKQVFESGTPTILKQAILTAPTSAAVLVIRNGYSSGETVLTVHQAIGGSNKVRLDGVRFDKGMHVKVTGVNAVCYLEMT